MAWEPELEAGIAQRREAGVAWGREMLIASGRIWVPKRGDRRQYFEGPGDEEHSLPLGGSGCEDQRQHFGELAGVYENCDSE